MDTRYTDLMKQGFMKPPKKRKKDARSKTEIAQGLAQKYNLHYGSQIVVSHGQYIIMHPITGIDNYATTARQAEFLASLWDPNNKYIKNNL